jgi:hypothetical protein
VIVCDSFEGLPRAVTSIDNDDWSKRDYLRVSQEQVSEHFRRFHLLSSSIVFEKGFFSHSMPILRKKMIEAKRRFSIIRLDGDMYESCFDILTNLYDLLEVNGFVIVDDYFGFPCRNFVDSFLTHIKDGAVIVSIDLMAVYWKKENVSLLLTPRK